MFVRWITRLYVTPERDDTQATALSAVLVESKRVNGQPRQRHIAYLGGINQNGIRRPLARVQFWDQVAAAFDKLDNQISRDDRKRFEAVIAAKVRRPTTKECNAVKAALAEADKARAEKLPMLLREAAIFRVAQITADSFLSRFSAEDIANSIIAKAGPDKAKEIADGITAILKAKRARAG